MFSAAIAASLRQHGHDVLAITERADIRGQADDAVFRIAQIEGRALVTENAADLRVIAHAYLSRGDQHAGLILTTDRRYPRHEPRTTGRLVRALHELLERDLSIASSEYWLP